MGSIQQSLYSRARQGYLFDALVVSIARNRVPITHFAVHLHRQFKGVIRRFRWVVLIQGTLRSSIQRKVSECSVTAVAASK